MKKVYIAGKLSQRSEYHTVREVLWNFGVEVTSRWIDDHSTGFGGEHALPIALTDLQSIDEADVFILDTTQPLGEGGGGGREFEFGYAVLRKPCWRVGPQNSAFHSLAVKVFADWREVYVWLEKNMTR